jgi:uncharacterized membrane protein
VTRNVNDAIGEALGREAREALQSASRSLRNGSRGTLSDPRRVAVGAGVAALAPLATMGAGKLICAGLGNGTRPLQTLGGSVRDAAGRAGDAGKGLVSRDRRGGSKRVPGVGAGRRMPVQQARDVAVPLKVAYNQWTQFEQWPAFMHRLQAVTQEDDAHVTFKTKIWGISKEFTAEIVEQRPDDRIRWRVTEGPSHTGVVSFHELADRLTRIEVTIDVEPGSPLEKAARGLRHVKRAVRGDLARFKSYVETQEEETGAWRGSIADGKVQKPSARRKSGSSSARSRSSAQSASSSRARSRAGSTRSRGSSNGSSRSSASRSGRGKSASRS